MEAPVKGWLHKTRKGMMMKAAQRHRRWFVLEGTTLSWYVDDSETAETPDAKGSIDVRGATVETTKALQFNLEFATGRRDKLEAESQEDVNAWARVRARARARVRPGLARASLSPRAALRAFFRPLVSRYTRSARRRRCRYRIGRSSPTAAAAPVSDRARACRRDRALGRSCTACSSAST